MTEEQTLNLYISLTESVHVYWGAFGAVAIVLFGWVLSRKEAISLSQKLALSVGWLVSAGYLSSSLMGKYRLLNALIKDIEVFQQNAQLSKTNLLNAITEFSSVYSSYEILVWTSFGLITLGVLFVLWSNVLLDSGSR